MIPHGAAYEVEQATLTLRMDPNWHTNAGLCICSQSSYGDGTFLRRVRERVKVFDRPNRQKGI